MKLKTFKEMKNTALVIGAIIVLLYLILSLIESSMKLFVIIVLLPLLIWAVMGWKFERQAGVMAFVIGVITIIWFIIDFTILRTQQLYWHIPVFILIAPLPMFIIGWILIKYADRKYGKKKKK